MKLQIAEKEIVVLREREYHSPKRTIGTSGSISPRERD